MSTHNLKALARFSDSLSHAYLEHAVIEREEHSVAAFTAEGRITLPAANLSTLMLGPGTRITHAAIKILSDCGVVVVWTGSEGLALYACGQSKTRLSRGIELQARHWADPELHLQVVRRMYQKRFSEHLQPGLTLAQIRGKEGVRVRDTYQRLALEYSVSWTGRSYERSKWQENDPINRALSAANAALYAIALGCLHSLGYSPSLGFVHTGKQLSFVYDIADLVKTETSMPAAFEAVSTGVERVESAARRILRDRCSTVRLQDKLTQMIPKLFCSEANDTLIAMEESVSGLWDQTGVIPGGHLHGGDDS